MFSVIFGAKLLTQLWLTSDRAVMTLAAPSSRCTLIRLKARCLRCTPGLITLIIAVCLFECAIFARSLQQADAQPSDGGPDGAMAEGRDVTTRHWLRSVTHRGLKTSFTQLMSQHEWLTFKRDRHFDKMTKYTRQCQYFFLIFNRYGSKWVFSFASSA